MQCPFRLVVRPDKPDIVVGTDLQESYVGDEAQNKQGVLTLKHPIEPDNVTNWDNMWKIWTDE